MPLSFVSHNPIIEDCANDWKNIPGRVRFDMHLHSVYSDDSIIRVDTIVRSWKKTGILPLVCDHDSIKGSEKVYAEIRRIKPDIPEILAEEIMTADGEIIGVFLNEEIPPGLSADETFDIIKDQGAISIIPHPFCTLRTTVIDKEVLKSCINKVNIIEGFNARTLDPQENIIGQIFAKNHKKLISIGSDAHTPFELARNYITTDIFSTPGELLKNLRKTDISDRVLWGSQNNFSINTGEEGICFCPAPQEVNEFTILFKKMRRENALGMPFQLEQAIIH